MAKPTTKQALTDAANGQFDKMWALLGTLTQEEQRGSFDFDGKEAHWKRDKNIRDIFIHLYEWHQLLLTWADSNLNGIEQPFLPQPYNWKTYGEMNVLFWQKHQNTSYDDSVKMLRESHGQVILLLEKLSEEELFSKGILPWTGGSTFGQYCSSATASHYDWAMKKIKRYKKELAV